MKIFKKIVQYEDLEIILETGKIARQADSSIVVRAKDAMILITVVTEKEKNNLNANKFFPLTVNYQERMYSTGRIPGSFLKREGRPHDKETLTARLIDRSIRPLFSKGYMNEVQVVITVMSIDPDVQSDILALIGVSAALSLSGAPFKGPIGAARIGFIDGNYLLNPTKVQIENSELDLIISGTENSIAMVESEAKQLPEEVVLGAILFGHKKMQIIIQGIKEMIKIIGNKDKWPIQDNTPSLSLITQVTKIAKDNIIQAFSEKNKKLRIEKLKQNKQNILEQLVNEENINPSSNEICSIIKELEKNHVRQNILSGEMRVDGRDTCTVRPILIEKGILKRAHGSALFTRGETQAIVSVTLGNDRDAQILDTATTISSEARDRFMLHYNFPPYSVGECGVIGPSKRREIGHGILARRAISAVLPSIELNPYVLRVVSEVTESNGSSSMATVCGASLALMNAGIPLKAPVAGIAMGLIKDNNKFSILTDITGEEDQLGDMDFKVAGTANGITALQMDIKTLGINKEIMSTALNQAKEGRLHILKLMNEIIDGTEKMSEYAPRIYTMKIKREKIKEVIGKGGSTIRSITEETGVTIDLEDDGTIKIFSTNNQDAIRAKKRIENIIIEPEVGKIYEGTVARITDFGAFVTILPGKDGLVHVSQISHEHVKNVNDCLKIGQKIKVKVLEIDHQGRVRLSMKVLLDTLNKKKNNNEEIIRR